MQPVFVSREKELSRLGACLDAAVSGRGQVCFVTGEGGSGKTTLTREFALRSQARHDSLLIATGNCNAHTGIGDPYLPFRELLGLLTGVAEERSRQVAINQENAGRVSRFLNVSRRVIADLGPDLADILVPGAGIATKVGKLVVHDSGLLKRVGVGAGEDRVATAGVAVGPSDQARVFEQYTAVLKALADERPLVLVLDDLQWIDESSASLLFHLARRIDGSRILLIASYRPEDVALGRSEDRHPLASVLAEIKREFGNVTIALDDAHDAEAREFVDALIDAQPNRLGSAFRQALVRRTRGHPLFTTELLRSMRERGDLVQDPEGRWIEGARLDWDRLPERVEGAIEERIRRLPQETQYLLAVASVEGETFTVEVLASLLKQDVRVLLRVLTQELDRQHGLVREEGRESVGGKRLSRFRFRHNFFQAYVYDTLGESERELLHEDVAEALRALHAGQLDEVAVALGRHYELAQSLEQAAQFYLHAARRALVVFAYGEASSLAERALAAAGAAAPGDGTQRLALEAQLVLGHALRLYGQWQRSMATFQAAAGAAAGVGDAQALAEAALGYEHPRYRYNLPLGVSLDLLNRALATLPAEDSLLRVQVMAGLARASGSLESQASSRAVALSDESIAMARRLGHPRALVEALFMRILLDRSPSEMPRRLAHVNEAVTLARGLGDTRLLLDIVELHFMHLIAVGAPVEAGFIAEHERLAGELRDPFYRYTTASIRVWEAFMAGRFDLAEQCAVQAMSIGSEFEVGSADGIFGIHMFTIRREQGRLREIAPLVRHFLRDSGAASSWGPGLAVILADIGEHDEAREHYGRLAADDFRSVPHDALWQTCLAYLADACVDLGDRDRARTLYDMMLPYADLNVLVGVDFHLGATGRYLGRLAVLRGDWDAAEAHFERALQLDAGSGARPWLAHTQYRYGHALQKRGRTQDVERARGLIAAARAAAFDMGMHGLLERIDAGGDSPPPLS
jgi:tetratricopeptide (TPR) repeat protein